MKRYGHLFEEICTFENLVNSAKKAIKGKKDKPHIAAFFFNLEFEIIRLQKELLNKTYQPLPYTCFNICEPKRRYICAADIRDRVVHHAVCNILEPIFERVFIYDSYACRKNKGAHKAVKRVQSWCRKKSYFFKSDIAGFFASIDHEILKNLICRKIKDPELLRLINVIIDHPVPGQNSGKGLAIGNLTSQWWANYYLDALDHFIKDRLGIKNYIRYMDDFLILDNDKVKLHLIKSEITGFLLQNLKLQLKERATFIAPVMQGIPFLGFRIFPGTIRLKHETLVRFKRKFRAGKNAWLNGSLDEESFIRSAASLIGHIQHANTLKMRQKFFNQGL